ncbi:hypothetical protein D9M71_512850 [compost metagenome]
MADDGAVDPQHVGQQCWLQAPAQVDHRSAAQVALQPGAPGQQQGIAGQCRFAQQFQVVAAECQRDRHIGGQVEYRAQPVRE